MKTAIKSLMTKVAETLQSEIVQATEIFSGLQRTRNSSLLKHHERHIGIFSNFEKFLSLLHAQVNDKCPGSSHSSLNRHFSIKWIENYDADVLFSRSFMLLVPLINNNN